MININVFSEEKAWSKKIKNKELFFKKLFQTFPTKYKFINRKVSLSLLLSNNKCIKKLNNDFRNKNKATDVLSFPFSKKIKISKQTYIGDIIISYNFINKPKSQNLELFEQKLIKTFIHGFLHLLGFDHIKDNDHIKMQKEEEKIYQSVISTLK
jgi:probable rRNA maturation factor